MAKFILGASTYITASGENTTFQLTPPGEKTTGDFQAGRIQDDENPTDAVDLGEDKYTEIEFCIQPTDEAEVGETYEFRLTKSDLWLPTSIGGCKRWGQSDSLITKDEVDRASIYGDKTGNGNHYIQATDSKKFVWTADQIDGHPALIGDDVDDYMGCASLASLLSGNQIPFSLFLVAKFTGENYQYPFCLGHSTGTGSHWLRTTYLPTWCILTIDDASNVGTIEGGVPSAGWHYVRYNFNGILANVWVDNVQVITNGYVAVGVSTFDEATLNSRKYAGAYSGSMGMQYAEDGIYDNVISAPDAALLDSYVAARYPSI